MAKEVKKILSVKAISIICIIVLLASFFVIPSKVFASKLTLSKKELVKRMKLFYPINNLKEKRFKKVKSLVKQKNFIEALNEAEKLVSSNGDLKANYCLQAVKSYYLIGNNWSRYSETSTCLLTFMAWIELTNENYSKAIEITEKCIELYGKEAISQQMLLNDFSSKYNTRHNWALNDVGTCLYIKGESHLRLREYRKAYSSFKKISMNYSFAQCFDPSKGFWKASATSEKKIVKLEKKYGIKNTLIASVPEKKRIYSQQKQYIKPKDYSKKSKNGDVIITEERITEKDIIEQQKAMTSQESERSFTKTALEDLLVEDIELDDDLLSYTTTEEKIESVINNNDIAEKEHREKMRKEKEQLSRINEKIKQEKTELMSILKQLGEPPIISLVLKKGNEEEALKSIQKQKEEKKKLLKNRIIADKKATEEIAFQRTPELPERKVYDPPNKRNLKETIVYVKKNLSLRWTNQVNERGMYEVILKRKGSREVKEFSDLNEFYAYAEGLGFSI
ncbi:MAG: hypothetical protein KAI43_07575 [Candidatus Aureabacteria bacterium]|nr:hypothetical protein [Candidatus Auribacterota bacterium]